MFENVYNVTEETADEVIDEIITWEKYYGVDYEADESEYWRNNNDYLETDETLEDEYWRLYDKQKQIRRTIDTCYNFEYLTPEQETELQALLNEEEKIGFKLDEIEIELRAE